MVWKTGKNQRQGFCLCLGCRNCLKSCVRVYVNEKWLVNGSVRFSNSFSCEALRHEGAHADKETQYKEIFQYPLLSSQTITIFSRTYVLD